MVVFPIMITLIYGAGPPFLPRTFSAGSSESPQGLNSVETTLLNQTIEVCSNQWSELGRRTWLYKEETIDCTCGIFVLLSRAGSTIWFVISRVFEPNQLSWFFPYFFLLRIYTLGAGWRSWGAHLFLDYWRRASITSSDSRLCWWRNRAFNHLSACESTSSSSNTYNWMSI